MMLLRLLFICLLLFNHTVYSDSHHESNQHIIVLGDSLSAEYGIESGKGWVYLLHNRLQEQGLSSKWSLINASISGDTTAGGLDRLPKLIEQYQPALCIIALGANDGLRGLSLDSMQMNLHNMIKTCESTGTTLLIGMHLPPNYGSTYTNAFHQVYANVAKMNDIQLVPFMLDGIALEDKYFQPDRLHPTAEAQPVILENIWPFLTNILENY